jgi:hypothetical protein
MLVDAVVDDGQQLAASAQQHFTTTTTCCSHDGIFYVKDEQHSDTRRQYFKAKEQKNQFGDREFKGGEQLMDEEQLDMTAEHQMKPYSIFTACVTPTNTPCEEDAQGSSIYLLPSSTSAAFLFPPKSSTTSAEYAASGPNHQQEEPQQSADCANVPTSWSCYDFTHGRARGLTHSRSHIAGADGNYGTGSSMAMTTASSRRGGPPPTSRSMIWSLWSRTTSLLLARRQQGGEPEQN